MKSLKEFIAENLENPTVTIVQENAEKQVEENNNQEAVTENGENKQTEKDK